MRYFIQLSYDGEAYCGWQIQPNGNTVQETLQKALSITSRTEISVVGQGRTDAGVHALKSYAHFDIEKLPFDLTQWVYKLNTFLPKDIAIQQIVPVNEDAHARFSALSRSYRYIISTTKNPFWHNRAWEIYRTLDVQRMEEAAQLLKGKHDFTSFSSMKSDTESRVCDVKHLDLSTDGTFIYVDITADRFVMNMVRTIVGTLVEVGLEKRKPSEMVKIIAALDRKKAGENAPPHALYLREVKYPEHIFSV